MSMSLLVLILSLYFIGCRSSCPEPCKCTENEASCRNSSLADIPDNIPDHITKLDFSYNKLSEIPNNLFINKSILNIEDLNLDWNFDTKLHPESFRGLTKLRWLYLTGDNVRNLNPDQFMYNPALEKLIMYHNVFTLPTNGSLLNSISLKEFWIGACDITTIPNDVFIGLPNLELLALGHNHIQVLRQDVFKPLKNLKTLYLNENRLKILQKQTFDPLNNIEVIHLNKNNLKYLPVEIAEKPKLKELTLQDNPFDCDCRLYRTWWKLSINGVKNENAFCVTPQNMTWDEAYRATDCDDDEEGDRVLVSGSPSQVTSTKRTTTTTENSAPCVIWGDIGC